MCQNLNTSDMFWMNRVLMRQCCKKVVSDWKVAGVIRPLVSDKGLQLECARVLYKGLLVLFSFMVVRQ